MTNTPMTAMTSAVDSVPTFEKFTILVIDDTEDCLYLMQSILSDRYRVQLASSGLQGLEIANAFDSPDLILLDILMPSMDGYEVCRQLKAKGAIKSVGRLNANFGSYCAPYIKKSRRQT